MSASQPRRRRAQTQQRDGDAPDLMAVLDGLAAHQSQEVRDALAELMESTPPRELLSRRERARRRKYPLEPLLLDDVERLLRECRPQGRKGPTYDRSSARLRVAIVIMYRTGMRVSEMLDLTERDLDQDAGTLFIRCGKGGVARFVGMDAWGWQEVNAWLDIRHEIGPGYLVPVIKHPGAGARWAASDLRRQMRAAGRRAGLLKRPHPHALRHGWAVEARREGNDLLTIQAQLGHADLTTTEIYMGGIDHMERLAPIINRRAPMIELPHAPMRGIGDHEPVPLPG